MKKLFKAAADNIDAVLYFVAIILIDVTVYCVSWFAGGLVTAATLLLTAWLAEVLSQKRERG